MKVFLTGGTGFVGGHFAASLLEKGATVYALVRNPNALKGLQGLPVRVLAGDLDSIPELPRDLDFVFHLAALTKAQKPEAYYSVNHLGTASILHALASQGLRPTVIYVSSLAAGGTAVEGRPRREDDLALPISPYGKSKLLGEKEALSYKDRFPVLIVRVGAVYGPRDKDFLEYFKLVAKGILPSLAGYDPIVSLIYIKDLIRALNLCARVRLPSGEIINVADPQATAWSDLGRAAARILGKRALPLPVPRPLMFTAAFLSEAAGRLTGRMTALTLNKYREMKEGPWSADTGKARTLLGFETEYSLERGLKETLDWYLENKWL
jgi:dihydroflavonol-4-reductase